MTLGYKQKMPDPWADVDIKYPEGSRVSGKVVSLTEYGAFVEVEEALEGLVHASEIEWAPRPKHPSKYLSVGDEVEAVVLKADKDEHLARVEEDLQHYLGTRVRVMHGKKRGRLEISYYSNEDLERILNLIRR